MAAPTISGISPSSGTSAGGNSVVITGTNFTAPTVTTVTFAGEPVAFTVDSGTRITATVPAHASGVVAVAVTNADNTATTSYTYGRGLTLVPTSGAAAGGTTVDIYGTNLGGTTQIRFGNKQATSFQQISASHLKAVSPSGVGVVQVTVTTAGGTSSPSDFAYILPPIKNSLSPTGGPLAGGTVVTILGAYLGGTSSVTFGGTPGTITANTNTSITATTPAKTTTGPASVVVTTSGGSSNGLTFTYAGAPVVSTLSPSGGPLGGGTSVTITGTNLANASSVTFGGIPATITANTNTSITATTPAQATAGPAPVVATTPGGSASSTYTYLSAPFISTLSPSGGPLGGGTSVTITGTNLANASSVTFGGIPATITANTNTSITATTPAQATAGPAPVVATTPGGTSNAVTFTYIGAPTVTNITPNPSSRTGGVATVIVGTNLSTVTAVTFGTVGATVGIVSDTQILVSTPPHLPGKVSVTVTNPAGSASINYNYN